MPISAVLAVFSSPYFNKGELSGSFGWEVVTAFETSRTESLLDFCMIGGKCRTAGLFRVFRLLNYIV